MPGRPHPIHTFAQQGNLHALERELAQGTPVDLRSPLTHRTPLMEALAAPVHHPGVIHCLLQHGANINAHAEEPSLLSLDPDIFDSLVKNFPESITRHRSGGRPEKPDHTGARQRAPH